MLGGEDSYWRSCFHFLHLRIIWIKIIAGLLWSMLGLCVIAFRCLYAIFRCLYAIFRCIQQYSTNVCIPCMKQLAIYLPCASREAAPLPSREYGCRNGCHLWEGLIHGYSFPLPKNQHWILCEFGLYPIGRTVVLSEITVRLQHDQFVFIFHLHISSVPD